MLSSPFVLIQSREAGLFVLDIAQNAVQIERVTKNVWQLVNFINPFL